MIITETYSPGTQNEVNLPKYTKLCHCLPADVDFKSVIYPLHPLVSSAQPPLAPGILYSAGRFLTILPTHLSINALISFLLVMRASISLVSLAVILFNAMTVSATTSSGGGQSALLSRSSTHLATLHKVNYERSRLYDRSISADREFNKRRLRHQAREPYFKPPTEEEAKLLDFSRLHNDGKAPPDAKTNEYWRMLQRFRETEHKERPITSDAPSRP
ncbi:hypothetical protein BC835DRAFT_15982 [Cytidiella melzeri]|nr:hypothetical protein BC835DRAFT_15982 [Cytidiella melzeri]